MPKASFRLYWFGDARFSVNLFHLSFEIVQLSS